MAQVPTKVEEGNLLSLLIPPLGMKGRTSITFEVNIHFGGIFLYFCDDQ